MKLILLTFLLAFANISLAYASRTPEQCRLSCGTSPDNWCLSFGSSAKTTALPYISIFKSAEKKLNGNTGDTCNQTITVSGANLELAGSQCTHQKIGTDLVVKTEYAPKAHAEIKFINNVVEVYFKSGNPKFSLKSGSAELSGEVEYITSTVELNGEPKVVWFNGEECFSALVNY